MLLPTIQEARTTWEKTHKTGKVGALPNILYLLYKYPDTASDVNNYCCLSNSRGNVPILGIIPRDR